MTEKPSGSSTPHPQTEDIMSGLLQHHNSFLLGIVENHTLFISNLLRELNSIIDISAQTNVTSRYLVEDPTILRFPAIKLSDYMYIKQLGTIVNSLGTDSGWDKLNACVVNYYPKVKSLKNPHSDTES